MENLQGGRGRGYQGDTKGMFQFLLLSGIEPSEPYAMQEAVWDCGQCLEVPCKYLLVEIVAIWWNALAYASMRRGHVSPFPWESLSS